MGLGKMILTIFLMVLGTSFFMTAIASNSSPDVKSKKIPFIMTALSGISFLVAFSLIDL